MQRLLFEADLLDTDRPRPTPPTRDQTGFYTAVRRLGLDVAEILPAHGKPVAWADFAGAFKGEGK